MSLQKNGLNRLIHMDSFYDHFMNFLKRRQCQLHCCQRSKGKLSYLIKKIFICFPKMNKSLTSLERHEVE